MGLDMAAEEQFWLKNPITKRLFDALDIENNLEITLCPSGYFHGDLQIGSYRSLLTESTPNDLRFRMTTQLRDGVWNMVKDIEEGN